MGYLDNTGLAYLWGKIKAKLVQPDWNQNDPAAADYVKNRPFYTEVVYTEILPETSVTTEAYEGLFVAEIPPIDFTIGNTYDVTFDGTKYNVVAISVGEGAALGELGDAVPDFTNYPFLVMNNGMLGTQTAGTHVVSVSGNVIVDHKIDEKYMPGNAQIIFRLPKTCTTEELAGAIAAIERNEQVRWGGEFIKHIVGSAGSNIGVVWGASGTESYAELSPDSNGRYTFTDSANAYPDRVEISADIIRIAPRLSFSGGGVGAGVLFHGGRVQITWDGKIIVNSSTPSSKKKFKITVDDTGTISATEVTT